jgi:type III restriction enzyme
VGDAVIENPILNSPYDVPTAHWRFDDDGITDDVVPSRRPSGYFVPIPAARRQGKQMLLQTDWTRDRLKPNDVVNQVRGRVQLWREKGRPGTTATTRALLDHWIDPDRERRLFFAQVEAVETAIYLAEVAHKEGDHWIARQLGDAADEANPGLVRVAMKMATGSGKTTVMGMLIAWQTLNRATLAGAAPSPTRSSSSRRASRSVTGSGCSCRATRRTCTPSATSCPRTCAPGSPAPRSS